MRKNVKKHGVLVKCILLFALVFFLLFRGNEEVLVCTHDSRYASIVPSTCSRNGHKDILCEKCNCVIDTFCIPKIDHSFTDWLETVKATSEHDGLAEHKCKNCGTTESKTIPYVFVPSSPDITLSYEYVENNEYMPYGLITPSSATPDNKIPLIVSLHGMGDRETSGAVFSEKFVVKAMKNWELDGFNAYVLFPHLSGPFRENIWNDAWCVERVFELINYIVEEYNIDTNKIIITGQSLGGHGCLYMAGYRPDFFSAIVPISPFISNADLNNINKDTAFRCYVGSRVYEEAENSLSFTFNYIKNLWGEDKIFQRDVSHDQIPVVAFTEDLNGDNKSDLIEWMLMQTKAKDA